MGWVLLQLLVSGLLFFGSELGRLAFTKYLLCSIPMAGAIMMSRRAALAFARNIFRIAMMRHDASAGASFQFP